MDTELQKEKVLIETLKFFIKLNIVLIPFYIVIYFNLSYLPLQIIVANLTVIIIRIFGFEISQDGVLLFLGKDKFPIEISFDCVGWKSTYSLFALLIASPGTTKQKLYFLARWTPILIGINLFRIIIVLLMGYLIDYNIIYPIHTYISQPLMILVVIGIWFIWIKKKKIYRNKV